MQLVKLIHNWINIFTHFLGTETEGFLARGGQGRQAEDQQHLGRGARGEMCVQRVNIVTNL